MLPPSPPPPPPSPGEHFAGAPLSVSAPSVGTTLWTPWDTQKAASDGGAGIVNPTFANGSWGGIPWPGPGHAFETVSHPYLGALGFMWSNTAAYIMRPAPDGAVMNLSDYDHTGGPALAPYAGPFFDSGAGQVWNLTNARGATIGTPRDINDNPNQTKPFTLNMNRCEQITGEIVIAQGPLVSNQIDCLIRNQANVVWFAGINVAWPIKFNILRSRITGGGANAPPPAHLETLQMLEAGGVDYGCEFIMEDTMVDMTLDGQATNANGGWTGWISIDNARVRFKNSILKGAPEVNANPLTPNIFGAWIGHGDNMITHNEVIDGAKVFDNVAMDIGLYGWTKNHSGTLIPAAGPNNRTYIDNIPITQLGF